MNYAIIGMGFIYPRHVQAIQDVGSKVVVTCDIDPTKNPDFTDYRIMLADPIMKEVDAVVICAPNHLHAEMIRAALKAGKRVLCEKPLSVNTDFWGLDGVAVVHQLHYHPLFEEIVTSLRNSKRVKMVLKAYRDEEFWKNPWKGDEQKSGGVVYILGSHIFDLLMYALPQEYRLAGVVDTMKKSTGIIIFENTIVEFWMEFLDSREGQTRHLEIDGKKYQLSIKDNLSFEGLHDKVYRAFEEGKTLGLEDVTRSIKLIDDIKKYC